MAGSKRIILEKQGKHYVLRDSASGLLLPFQGYGALKGQVTFRDDIDPTKPIYEQVMKIESRRKKPASKKNETAA